LLLLLFLLLLLLRAQAVRNKALDELQHGLVVWLAAQQAALALLRLLLSEPAG
jgi:hypothetical protein